MWYYKQKNKVYHNFVINDQEWIALFLNYKEETRHIWSNNKRYGTRVFWQFRNGKHHGQPLGKDWFYKYPQEIAKFLNLPDPDSYSGHSICGTGTTIYANTRCSLLQLKKYGAWKSDKTAEIYYKDSEKQRVDTAEAITNEIDQSQSQKNRNYHNHNHKRQSREYDDDTIDTNPIPSKKSKLSLTFNNCNFNNCTFTS